MALELLGSLGRYCTILRDALRDGQDETSRLEEVGVLARSFFGVSTGWQGGPSPEDLENEW